MRSQKVLQVVVRRNLQEWWDSVVEPAIAASGKTRSAFIMAAVMAYIGGKEATNG